MASTTRRAGLALVATLLALAGCGNRSGRQVTSEQRYNLTVSNTSSSRTLYVYAAHDRLDASSAGRVGEVPPGQVGYFRLHGRLRIYLRHRGESFMDRERPDDGHETFHFDEGHTYAISG